MAEFAIGIDFFFLRCFEDTYYITYKSVRPLSNHKVYIN